MMSSSFIYCNMCGAANQAQATLCYACGHPLETAVEDTAPPSPAGPLASRPLLAGRYRLIALVGEGGFGAVYKAVDMQRDGALVALKQINLSGLRPRDVIEATETFNREVGMLSGLKHPNLPRIYDYFTDVEHWYLAMDFIEGQTLEEYLKNAKGGHLPVKKVLEIGIQLCSVLSYLHTQQPPIIFRDVKPANVMRAATGLLYLIDFGIARRFTPGQRRDTTVLGSPGYAPPEQYGTAQTTAQSDIYSLGATLRCLLTGTDPAVPAPGSASPYVQGVPAKLNRLLVEMLEPEADKRPVSMEVVKQALQEIQSAHHPPQHAGSARQQRPFTWPAGQALQPPVKGGISRRAVIMSVLRSGGRMRSIAKHGISRRAVIIGLAGVATVGCGIAWWLDLSQALQAPQASQAPQTPQGLPATSPPTPYVDPYRLYAYQGHTGPVFAVAWSPDSRHIASGGADGTVQVWVASTGGNVLTYGGHYDVVDAVAWSPDSRRIASASFDKTVQVWNAATGETLLTYTGHLNAVIGYLNAYAVAWSPDGKRIASGGGDGTVQVWDATTGGNALTYRGHSGPVFAVAWSPDGRHIVSGSNDNTAQVWDAATGRGVLTYKGHSNTVLAVAWSPDGKLIASGSNDKTVQVWDPFTGGNVLTFKGRSGVVYAVAWSPDGERIASGSNDNTAQVWDAATGRSVLTYKGHSNTVLAVAWSPDGNRIASASADSTVQVWNAP